MCSDIAARSSTVDRPLRGIGAVLLTLSGLAAAFGVASCCALPFLLATIGLGTAWLGGSATLAAPHIGVLRAAAAICLMGGGSLLWWQRKVIACAAGGICTHPTIRGLTLVGLLAGVALLYLGYAYA